MAKRGRIVVDDSWTKHRSGLERAFRRGLPHGAAEAARAAENVPTKYNIRDIMRTHVLAVRRTRRGWSIAIGASDWRAPFFNTGTYGGQRIKPLRFLRKGITRERGAFEDAVAREFRRL